jgi:hypothetical protein
MRRLLLVIVVLSTGCSSFSGYRRFEDALDKRERNIVEAIVAYKSAINGENCTVRVSSRRTCPGPIDNRCPQVTEHIARLHCIDSFLEGELDGENLVVFLVTYWRRVGGYWLMTDKVKLTYEEIMLNKSPHVTDYTRQKLRELMEDEDERLK